MDESIVAQMVSALHHRGPDQHAVVRVANSLIGSARLAIVDREHGVQPFANRDGSIKVVYNGEIYNHLELREELLAGGYPMQSRCDGEVVPHLYQQYGPSFVDRLDGQFAIALVDERDGSLLLARDRMGICPLYWMSTPEGLYFASEIKAFYAIGLSPKSLNPTALLQLAYFGTICAPVTPFESVYALPPAHIMRVDAGGQHSIRRYWRLSFPARGEELLPAGRYAASMLLELLSKSVGAHAQGDLDVAAFLSGGVDSTVITALLAAHQGAASTQAFCVSSPVATHDEKDEAAESARYLGVPFHSIEIDDAKIANSFERLLYHAETPVTSTESAALMLLSQAVNGQSKVVLTGEGADEAFGGYLAFRQQRMFGFLVEPRLRPLRRYVRPALRRHFGTDCLVPTENRLASLHGHLGFFPAQAYEWEFYRSAISSVLSPQYAQMLEDDGQWHGVDLALSANAQAHWLNRSLDVGYQVMLPNYLLGPHGDRILAANSIEGRYPFLSRQVVEFAGSLHPALKLRGSQEKHVLRQAAECLVPRQTAWRKKHRFTMPFGTPFLRPSAPPLFSHLLAPATIASYGYFDIAAVADISRRVLSAAPKNTPAAMYLERLAVGIAMTVVVSTQLWHYVFVEKASSYCSFRDAEPGAQVRV